MAGEGDSGGPHPGRDQDLPHNAVGGPAFCRAYVLEPLAAGPEIGALWEKVLSGFAATFQHGLPSARYAREGFPHLPEENFLAMVGGFHALVVRHIRLGKCSELPSLEPTLLHFVLSVLVGPSNAEAVLRRGDPIPVASTVDRSN